MDINKLDVQFKIIDDGGSNSELYIYIFGYLILLIWDDMSIIIFFEITYDGGNNLLNFHEW